MDLTKEILELKASIEELKTMLTSHQATSKTSDLPELISLKEVAKMLNITMQGLYFKRKAGELKTVATGSRVFVEKTEFQRFLSSSPKFNNKKTKK